MRWIFKYSGNSVANAFYGCGSEESVNWQEDTRNSPTCEESAQKKVQKVDYCGSIVIGFDVEHKCDLSASVTMRDVMCASHKPIGQVRPLCCTRQEKRVADGRAKLYHHFEKGQRAQKNTETDRSRRRRAFSQPLAYKGLFFSGQPPPSDLDGWASSTVLILTCH